MIILLLFKMFLFFHNHKKVECIKVLLKITLAHNWQTFLSQVSKVVLTNALPCLIL
jgi:hypothetical protein